MTSENKKRHDALWPEPAQAIRASGISDDAIFLDEQTDTLFAVQKLAPNNTAAELRPTAIRQKWWADLAPLVEVYPAPPVRVALTPVFHQD